MSDVELRARFVEVALPVPLRRRFTYALPEGIAVPAIGARVAVPFHGRKLAGFVLGHPERAPEGVKVIKPVAGVLDAEPLFPEELLRFLAEAADYYLHPIGEVLVVHHRHALLTGARHEPAHQRAARDQPDGRRSIGDRAPSHDHRAPDPAHHERGIGQ